MSEPKKVSFLNANQEIFNEVFYLREYVEKLASSMEGGFRYVSGQVGTLIETNKKTDEVARLSGEKKELENQLAAATARIVELENIGAAISLEELLNMFLKGDTEGVSKLLGKIGELKRVISPPAPLAEGDELDLVKVFTVS